MESLPTSRKTSPHDRSSGGTSVFCADGAPLASSSFARRSTIDHAYGSESRMHATNSSSSTVPRCAFSSKAAGTVSDTEPPELE
jgi:hypothetical protein